MPGMAEEVGANTAVVSIIQTMRVFLVVLAVPLFVVYWEVIQVGMQCQLLQVFLGGNHCYGQAF